MHIEFLKDISFVYYDTSNYLSMIGANHKSYPGFTKEEKEKFYRYIKSNGIVIIISEEIIYEIVNLKNGKTLYYDFIKFINPLVPNYLVIKSFDLIKEIEFENLYNNNVHSRYWDFYYNSNLQIVLNSFFSYIMQRKIRAFANKIYDETERITSPKFSIENKDQIKSSEKTLKNVKLSEIIGNQNNISISQDNMDEVKTRYEKLNIEERYNEEFILNSNEFGEKITKSIASEDYFLYKEAIIENNTAFKKTSVYQELKILIKEFNINYDIDNENYKNDTFLFYSFQQLVFLYKNSETLGDYLENNEYNFYAPNKFKNNKDLMEDFVKLLENDKLYELPGIFIHHFLTKQLKNEIKSNPIGTNKNKDTKISTNNESDILHATVIPYVNLFYTDKRMFSKLTKKGGKIRFAELNLNKNKELWGRKHFIAKITGTDIYSQVMDDLKRCVEMNC